MLKKLSSACAAVAACAMLVVGVGQAQAAPQVPIGGGSGILIDKGNDSGDACTLSAIGHDARGRLIGLTAGHCGSPGQHVFSENFVRSGQVGTITATNSKLDYAVVSFDASRVTPVRSVRGVTIRSVQTTAPQFPSVTCKTGRTTGKTCGVTFFSNRQSHLSAVCVAEGDSGSPVVVGDRLIGMVNAYYLAACIGPETGSNIGPILQSMSKAGFGGFHVV